MATDVQIRRRNSANTSDVALVDSNRAEVQILPNEMGNLEIFIDNDNFTDYAALTNGTMVQATVIPLGQVQSFRIGGRERVVVGSEEDEDAEETTIFGSTLHVDWDDSIVNHPRGPFDQDICLTDPPMQDRVMAWPGIDYTDAPGTGWSMTSKEIAIQGWVSEFWIGFPSGWSDPDARWIGPYSGDHTHAPSGDNLFIRYALIGVGKHRLQYAGDNAVRAFLNGEEIGGQTDYRQCAQYDFEVTRAGWIKLAFWLTNGPDDGPPGGNPTGLLYTLRIWPDGAVVCRSDVNTWMLEYPSTIPTVPIGRMIRRVAQDNPRLVPWSVTGTETHGGDGVAYPAVDSIAFKVDVDSAWDVVRQLAEVWIDSRPAVNGLTLEVVNKDYWRSTSGAVLETPYSPAGLTQDQDVVNVQQLKWRETPPLADILVVKWAKGSFRVGNVLTGQTVDRLDISQITDYAAAVLIAQAYMDIYGSPQFSASFKLDWNDAADLAFTCWSRLNVPAMANNAAKMLQDVRSVSYGSSEEGELEVTVEVGALQQSSEEWLTRAVERGAAVGLLRGRATFGTPPWRLPERQAVRPVASQWTIWTSTTGSSLASMVGTTATPANPPNAAVIRTFLLRGNNSGASGTSTVQLRINGVLQATVSLAAGATLAVLPVTIATVTPDQFTVTVTANGGHTGLVLQATISELGR